MAEAELKAKYRYVLDGISQIPSLPAVVSRLLSILNHPRTGADDVVHFLEMDVGIASKVLRLANSAYYGVPGGITSIQRAVIQLGFSTVSSVVISSSVYNLFKATGTQHSMNRVAFWRHSIETAIYCRVLAQQTTGRVDPEVAFTQGMLHDIGALVFDTAFPKEYATLVDTARKTGATLEEVEREHFGMDHSQIGGRILERWGLPEFLRTPIQLHHSPIIDNKYRDYVLVLALANDISHSKGLLLFPQQRHHARELQPTLELLGITTHPDVLSQLFEEELKRAKVILNLLRS